MDHSSRLRSLGEQVELLNGLPTQSQDAHETRASLNRKQWLDILRDSTQQTKFLLSLSGGQLSSHQLLQEWLTGRCDDAEFDSDAREAEHAFNANQQSGYASRPSHPHAYHYHLAKLLYSEFSYPGEGTPRELYFAILLQARKDAAIYASCQRLATSYYRTHTSFIQHRCTAKRQTGCLTPYGASVDPCFWLESGGLERRSLPYYLWDVREKKTRKVRDIAITAGTIPDYVAISHTWGRWMREHDPPVQLDNVPWEIPQNERFRVEDLPEILQTLPFDYIWLDLLTIPQKGLSDELVSIQQTEIGRQATIFRNAIQAIAWLHDVHDWSALRAIVRYLSLKFLANSPSRMVDTDILTSALNTASEDAGPIPELLFESEDKKKVHSIQRKPNAWFTSLWTLQETCLRPDMLLSTADWQILEDSEGVPVALNGIVALCSVNTKQYPTAPGPDGVQALRQLISMTGMENLLQLSQLSIITMGNERHCLERRAEAIMSAIGVTKWFEGTSKEQREENLVIELYPLPFVEEVRKRVGSAAFFSSTPVGWEFHYVLKKFCSEKRTKDRKFEELGSLLPFGPGAHAITFDIESNPHMTEHPALESWQVEESGCVRISQAGIVSSSCENQATTPLHCIIIAPSPENDENLLVIHEGDLHAWVHSYKSDSPNFAVCLLHSHLASRGILLRQMEPGILLKVGSYWQMERPDYVMPESQTVDWLVM
ncbi:hypothetical protein BDZ45DRAFT_811551 [Acephala macrosclerotiorum]|nr:hypothetical protein BDZ45DRAFT_811551 [Acephala macrosclerotiorum]